MWNKKLSYLPLMASAVLGLVVSADATIIGLNINAPSASNPVDDTANPNGIFWNSTQDNTTSPPAINNAKDSTGATTDFSISVVNSFGFMRNGDPNAVAAFDAFGYRFPTAVQQKGGADNFSGRDGLAVVRFTVPTSSNLVDWTITVLGGNNSPFSAWAINVGGTWGGTNDRTFTGGQTQTVTTSGLQVVQLTNIIPSIVGSDYVVDVQLGYLDPATQNSDVVVMRAIVVNAQVPEPAAVSALLLGAGAITMRRRR